MHFSFISILINSAHHHEGFGGGGGKVMRPKHKEPDTGMHGFLHRIFHFIDPRKVSTLTQVAASSWSYCGPELLHREHKSVFRPSIRR